MKPWAPCPGKSTDHLSSDDLVALRNDENSVIDRADSIAALQGPPRDRSDLNHPGGPLHTPSAMWLSCRYPASSCARQIRFTSSLRSTAALAQQRITRRYQSTDAAAAPTSSKISGIVDQISQLTLLETADLVTSLKVGNGDTCGLLQRAGARD